MMTYVNVQRGKSLRTCWIDTCTVVCTVSTVSCSTVAMLRAVKRQCNASPLEDSRQKGIDLLAIIQTIVFLINHYFILLNVNFSMYST